MDHGKKFATAFNCMDGRCQDEVRRFACSHSGAGYVDMVALAGMDGVLAGKTPAVPLDSAAAIALARYEAEVSTKTHGSTRAFVIGHTGCAGNPVTDEEHMHDIRKAVETVRSWGLFESVEGLMAMPDALGEWCLYSVEGAAPVKVVTGRRGWGIIRFPMIRPQARP